MKLAPAQWRSLSKLLDEALALPERERAPWIRMLGDEDDSIKSLLVELLDRPAGVSTADLIDTLPAFADPTDASAGAPGATVGPYRLIREAGRGGMGAVWLAERVDGLVKRQVALKLPILAASRQTLAERFAREREILAPLTHPNIARLYDAGFASDGRPYLALEFVEGDAITAYCDRERLTVRARCRLMLQVLSAVQYAHANLTLHRDLKPSNILVTTSGEIKLLDFGIAKLMAPEGAAQETALTKLAGRALTLDYAAPEQITGAPLSTACDVYALGVVLYELVCGRRPYRLKRDTPGALEDAILAQEVQRPSAALGDGDAIATCRSTTRKRLARELAGDLDTIVLKALRKSTADRYATAEAFAQDIERYLHGQPVSARPDSAWYRARKFVVRNRVSLGIGSAAAFALVGTAGVALWQAHVARLETSRATASKAFVDSLFARAARNNPGGAAAADTTARQLLDLGSRQLLEQSRGDPDVELDLVQWLARLNTELDSLQPASALAERAIALARELHGENSVPFAAALAQKADNLYRAASYRDAGNVAREALRIADKAPRDTVELRAKLHIIISNSAFQLDTSKTDEPQQHLESALELLKNWNRPTEERSRAAYYLAWIMEQKRDFASAEAFYRDGIAAGVANFGEKSFIVAFGYENLADMLRSDQRLPEAREAINKALAIYEFVLGARHGTIAFARTNLALIEAASGRTADAERIADQAVALAADVFGQSARQLAFPAMWAARIKAQRGELDAASPAYERTLAVFAASDPPTSRSIRAMQVEHAEVLIALGQLDRADKLLAQAAAAFESANDMRNAYVLRLEAARGAIASARGDARAARSRFDAALAIADASKVSSTGLPQLAATIARTRPDASLAQAMLDRLSAFELLPATADGLRIDVAERAKIAFAIGRLDLATDRVDEARAWLARAVELHETLDAPASPWLAEARGALADADRRLSLQPAVARTSHRERAH